MNPMVKRALAAILAIVMMTCVFASCGNGEAEEEITRGANSIASPTPSATTPAETNTETTPSTEATTAPETTTKKPTSNKGSTTQKAPSTTAPSKEVSNAAQGSGVDLSTVAALINAFGYNYDSDEGVFYTEIDSWQREGNYIKHYDTVAAFGNMTYLTTKVDFDYAGKNWRLQFWKGQYGVFGGAEIGVYYKNPGETEELYFCADDDHLMYMSYTMYLTPADYRSGHKYFTRGWQKHWWLTGFKAGVVVPTDLVMSARIRTYDANMAAAMEGGLQRAGFKKGDASSQMDTYKREGFDYFILWHSVGNTNY